MKSIRSLLTRTLAKWPRRGARRSYAKDGLDLKLEPFLRKRDGFFIEAGANDGLKQSNTLYFERHYGWRGLLVEPVPEFAARCRVNRPGCVVEECALVGADGPEFLDLTVAGLMSVADGAFASMDGYTREDHLVRAQGFGQVASGGGRKVRCPTRTLSELIVAHDLQHIDLLCLDVEGCEEQVLAGLDMERHRPRWVLVEQRHGSRLDAMLSPYYDPRAVLATNDHYADVLYARRDAF